MKDCPLYGNFNVRRDVDGYHSARACTHATRSLSRLESEQLLHSRVEITFVYFFSLAARCCTSASPNCLFKPPTPGVFVI